jgi:hypothetical protein
MNEIVKAAIIGAAAIFATLFVYGFMRSMCRQLKELPGTGPLSKEEAHLVWGNCLFIARGLAAAACLLILLASSAYIGWPAGLGSASACLAVAMLVWRLGSSRMKRSRRAGGYGARGHDP